jgi:acetyltransferase
LSEETVYQRYFEHINLESRIRHERLSRICTNDDDSFALVAARPGTIKNPAVIYAVGRLSKTPDPLKADFALLVNDKAQGRGIGSALIKRLINLARACGFRQLTGEVLVANHEMLYVCRHFGFTLHTLANDGLVEVSLDL